jgi:hypothetical protein
LGQGLARGAAAGEGAWNDHAGLRIGWGSLPWG